MKKWIVIFVVSFACAVAISVMRVDTTTEKQVIYIDGGEPVLADRINQTDQFVYYEADGKSGMFMNDDVTSVGSIQVKKKASILSIIDRNKRKLMTDMGFGQKAIGAADSRLIILAIVLILVSVSTLLILKLADITPKRAAPKSTDADNDSYPEKTGLLAVLGQASGFFGI